MRSFSTFRPIIFALQIKVWVPINLLWHLFLQKKSKNWVKFEKKWLIQNLKFDYRFLLNFINSALTTMRLVLSSAVWPRKRSYAVEQELNWFHLPINSFIRCHPSNSCEDFYQLWKLKFEVGLLRFYTYITPNFETYIKMAKWWYRMNLVTLQIWINGYVRWSRR